MRHWVFLRNKLAFYKKNTTIPSEPIRADFFSDEALAAMAKKIAAGQSGDLPFFTPFRLSSRLHDNAHKILHTFRSSDANAQQNGTISPATQWLVDNYYTIDKAIKQIRLSFPQKLIHRLPVYPPSPNIPRIFALAWFFVAHTDSAFSLENLTIAVRAYQKLMPLTIAELWILPAALRFVLIENARRIAVCIEHNTTMRQIANQAADEIILLRKEEENGAKLENFLARYNTYVGDTYFSNHLLSRLENAAIDTTVAIKWLHYKISEFAPSGTREVLGAEHNRQAANGVTMGNIIRAFKAIDDIDWAIWFESVCAVDFILRDHSDFSALDSSSRNIYRSAVEVISKSSNLNETEVAKKAIFLTQAEQISENSPIRAEKAKVRQNHMTSAAVPADTLARQGAVAQFLIGKKRRLLEKACDYRPPFEKQLGRAIKKLNIAGIVIPVFLLSIIFIFLIYGISHYSGLTQGISLLLAAAMILPAIDISFALFNTLVSWFMSPKPLIGYDFSSGIPADAQTLVAVPILITSKQNIDEQVRNLEVHYLSNMQDSVYFALVSDWKDSDQEETEADKILQNYASAQIAALNHRYPKKQKGKIADKAIFYAAKTAQNTDKDIILSDHAPLFFFLHRRRIFNKSENCFMGWERKRGKLHEMNRLLRGAQDTSFFPPDTVLPANIRYVLTLDSDTRLTRGSVAKLVGKMSHPLNRPQQNAKGQTIKEGYGLMQPRIVPSLSVGENTSVLQQLFSGERGLDPYVFAISDTYQDLLGEGTYTGKGLYEIDAFENAIKGHIKENSVLSHDLLEGSYARTAFVSDVELVEDYPISYYVDTARRHRWIRGDWQLLPYIFSQSGVIGAARWKMLDNLRRSLMPAAFILASLSGWCLLSSKGAIIWQLILLAGMYIAPLLGLLRNLVAFNRDYMLRGHLRLFLLKASGLFMYMLLHISFLAYAAYYSCDAIIRTVYRLTVSHKHLLEWQSSDITKNLPKTKFLSAYIRAMAPAIPVALLAFVIAFLCRQSGLYVGIPFILLWLSSPFIAWGVSRPATKHDALKLKADDRAALRRYARRNWTFYESFVNDASNHLPPDNFQEYPEPVLTQRTSPTNIGLYLLSVLAARDFGWISLRDALDRIHNTLASLEKLEKFSGHIYNWYTTDNLKPLDPLYISTVDSGNLAGHLVALSSALKNWEQKGLSLFYATKRGIIDNVDILAEALAALPNLPADSKSEISDKLESQLIALRQWAETIAEAEKDAVFRQKNESAIPETQTQNAAFIAKTAKNLSKIYKTDAGLFLSETAQALLRCCHAHNDDFTEAQKLQNATAERKALFLRIKNMAEKARQLAFAMQFGFLEHKNRRLLSIGYRVREKELDESCYDLLASEARLAVLFAIAKGDIKHEYWGRLGRIMVPVGWKGALLSWSGSMFEYLMPPLVMHEPLGSILDQTSKLIVRRQREYGAQLRRPWGISEAAFNARDAQMNYQYSAFGVPSLGLQRELSRNLVVAPYATMLAAQYAPTQAVANLKRLEKLGALGPYGYYDSLDFTPSRVQEGHDYAIVRNYYAHHHGMSIVAVANTTESDIMRQYFHSDAAIEAAELLLQEKAPCEIPLMNAKAFNPLRPYINRTEQNSVRTINRPITKPRATMLLSGGAYNVMLTATGSGYSNWNGFAVTRYQTDAAENQQGSLFFLRDTQTGRWWSTTDEPTRTPGEDMHTIFTAEKAEFYKHTDGIKSVVECLTVPGAEGHGEGEGRRISLFNQTPRSRILEIISYSELALNDPAADAAHPAFSRMFVETEICDGGKTIFAHRRPRTNEEATIHVAHFVTEAEGKILSTEAETSRRAFIGRGRSIRRPAFFDKNEVTEISNKNADGFVMDPVFSIRCRIKIPAYKKVNLVFWTMAAASRQKLIKDIAHYRCPDSFEREFTAAWTYSQIIRHQIGMTPKDVSNYQTYAGYLLFPERYWQAPKLITQKLGKQSDLWPMSISGDLPLCVLRIANEANIQVAKELLRAHEYWQNCGLIVDLVLLNERHFSYAQDTQQTLEWLCESYRNRSRDDKGKTHIFTPKKDQISEQSYNTLLGAAHIVLYAENGSLAEQLAHLDLANVEQNSEDDKSVHAVSIGLIAHEKKQRHWGLAKTIKEKAAKNSAVISKSSLNRNLLYWNGLGGFEKDGSYYIRRQGQQSTPQPWINIISNAHFGMHVSAGGAPFTWSGNSRDYQLTPWSNDPISNRPGEALYIVDLASKRRFSPVSAVECHEETIYETWHGFGWSGFTSEHDKILSELVHTVDTKLPLRFSRLRLTNKGTGIRHLRVYNYVEWVLGNNRAKTAPFLIPSYDTKRAALLVSNPYSINNSTYVSFVTASQKPSSITADRMEFIGATGTVKHPQAIRDGAPLSGKVKAGNDTCSALAYDMNLQPGETRELIFCLGNADNPENAHKLLDDAHLADFNTVLENQKQYWHNFTQNLQVETPDESFNLLVNHWLPYQAYACRIKARTAFYQSSGAFGLRDQLQDTLAMLLIKPELAREQIGNAACRQFREGDLQHWWLPESGAGVRTLISDDVVWLAYATALYVNTTGEMAFLNEEFPFLEGDALPAGKLDSYFQPGISAIKASLYDHCCLALNLAIKRTGQNGLPLILGGDWNDGMNNIGIGGKGESVWLGWFLGKTLHDFIPLAKTRGDKQNVQLWTDHLKKLTIALEKAGWDGAWYRRAYYDDGTPLGSHHNDECKIDTIAQSWSIISGLAPAKKQKIAFQSMLEQLYDDKTGILKLFWPPFSETVHNPGYIKAYPPGVRENGGQYTHGALWSIIAAAQIGEKEKAYELFSMVNPIHRGANPEIYKVEPYVVAADIYSVAPRQGMGGWTWYTGSAGWLYRAATEAILGIHKQGNRLFLNPSLPQAWKNIRLHWCFKQAIYTVIIKQEAKQASLTLDGEAITDRDGIPLEETGEHEIILFLKADNRAGKKGHNLKTKIVSPGKEALKENEAVLIKNKKTSKRSPKEKQNILPDK